MRPVSFKNFGKDLISLAMIGVLIATVILVFAYTRDEVLEKYDPNKVVMPTWPISQDDYRLLFVPESPGPLREGSGEVRNPEWNWLGKGKPTVDSMPRNPDGTPRVR